LTWTVEFDDAAAKELRKLDRQTPQTQRDILTYFRQRIATLISWQPNFMKLTFIFISWEMLIFRSKMGD
jgi:mRNA-degrading endonuclease RelE of RelBE toxin-antitoxin system